MDCGLFSKGQIIFQLIAESETQISLLMVKSWQYTKVSGLTQILDKLSVRYANYSVPI